jgi:hypothetical protein
MTENADDELPPAVMAAFRVEPALFTGEVRAAAVNFVKACREGTADQKDLETSFNGVFLMLAREYRSFAKIDLVAYANLAIKAATEGLRNNLFDSDSVPYRLGAGDDAREVQVLVTKDAKESTEVADSPFFRHTKVKQFSAVSAWHVAKHLSVSYNSLPLLYGASGAGKTMCGISVVAFMASASSPGACVRLRCTAATFRMSLTELLEPDPTIVPCLDRWRARNPNAEFFHIGVFEETYGQAATANQEERNSVVQRLVLRAMENVIEAKYRHPPRSAGLLVVFIDEAEQVPTFVRAMCACYLQLQTLISRQFSGGKCVVKIVVAGTGIEGANHDIGSEPLTTWLHHVQPDAWSVLVNHLPVGIRDLLTTDGTTLVRVVNGMCRNARVAAIFVDEMERLAVPARDLPNLNPMLALRTAATIAANSCKLANRRGELSTGAHLAVVLRAIAQQTSKAEVHSGAYSLAQYGLLVDRAETRLFIFTHKSKYELLARLGLEIDQPKGLFLLREYLGVRYELSAAHVMMLQLALGIADHSEAPDGFEKVVADFIAVAMELSRADIRMNFDFFKTTPPWEMPNGWTAPLTLAAGLRRSMPTAIVGCKPKEPQHDVDRVLSTRKLEPKSTRSVSPKQKKKKTSSDEATDDEAMDANDGDDSGLTLQQYLEKHIIPSQEPSKQAPRLGKVIVNYPLAKYADVIAFIGTDQLLLANAKRTTTGALSIPGVFRELYKMGHRDWRSVLAALSPEELAGTPPEVRAHAQKFGFKKRLETTPENVKRWLTEHGKRDVNQLTKLLGQNRRVTYAIMVYGKRPIALPVCVPETWPSVAGAPARPQMPTALHNALKLLVAEEPQTSDATEAARYAVETANAETEFLPQTLCEAMRKSRGHTQSQPLSHGQREYLRHELSVPEDVLLLFAPSPAHSGLNSTPDSKSYAAEQLWGYYPILVNPPLEPPHLRPIVMLTNDER